MTSPTWRKPTSHTGEVGEMLASPLVALRLLLSIFYSRKRSLVLGLSCGNVIFKRIPCTHFGRQAVSYRTKHTKTSPKLNILYTRSGSLAPWCFPK